MASIPPNHIYQYSLINALMSGVSSAGVPVSTLLQKGNQGLGTFIFMKGELLLLDGTCYQLLPAGRIRIASPDDQVPYAAVTNLVPEYTFENLKLASKASIGETLKQWDDGAENLFMTYRIEGRFGKMRCRTVEGQEYEGQPLSELGNKQFVDTYENIEGTVVGFRSPEMWQGFTVAGEHMHFIDRERKMGGHVLEIEEGLVTMGVAVVADVHIELPRSKKFNEARMSTDDVGLKAVEG